MVTSDPLLNFILLHILYPSLPARAAVFVLLLLVLSSYATTYCITLSSIVNIIFIFPSILIFVVYIISKYNLEQPRRFHPQLQARLQAHVRPNRWTHLEIKTEIDSLSASKPEV